MYSIFRWAGLALLLAALVFPALGADAKSKKKDGDDKSAKSKDNKKHEEEYVVIQQYEGVVTQITSGEKTFSATVIIHTPNQEAIKKLNELRAQLQGTTDIGTAQNLTKQIFETQAAVQKGAEEKVEKTFEASDEVKVRIGELPIEFDENGVRKKLTEVERRQKKGPGNLWGYPADFEQLANGTNVKLFLSVKKSTAEALKRRSTKKVVGRVKAKEPEGDPTDDDPPTVRMIYILPETKKPG
jgi:hypothetical protein